MQSIPTRPRSRYLKELVALSAFAGLALLVLIAWSWSLAARSDDVRQANDRIRARIAVYDRQIRGLREIEKEKENLVVRLHLIEALGKHRGEPVEALQVLVSAPRYGVRLDHLRYGQPQSDAASPPGEQLQLLLSGEAPDLRSVHALDEAIRQRIPTATVPGLQLDRHSRAGTDRQVFQLQYGPAGGPAGERSW